MAAANGLGDVRNIVIRQPLFIRGYSFAFGAIWFAFLTSALVRGTAHGSGTTFVLLLMLVVGLLIPYRVTRMSVIGEGDTFTVRNQWLTKRLRSSDIEGFRLGRSSFGPGVSAIHALLTDGTILTLDVTMAPTLFPSSKRKQAERLTRLRVWLDARSGGGTGAGPA